MCSLILLRSNAKINLTLCTLILWHECIVTGHSSWIGGLLFSLIFFVHTLLFFRRFFGCSMYRFLSVSCSPLSIFDAWNESGESIRGGGYFLGRAWLFLTSYVPFGWFDIIIFLFHPTESHSLTLLYLSLYPNLSVSVYVPPLITHTHNIRIQKGGTFLPPSFSYDMSTYRL